MISFQNPELLILLLIPILLLPKIRYFVGVKKEIGLLNILIAITLVLTFAGPQVTLEASSELDPQVTVVRDASESSSLINEPEYPEDEANIVYRSVNSDRSDFVSQIKSSTQEGETVLFVSDFQSSTGDLPEYFRENNISANVIRSDIKKEDAVRIEGPDTTVIGAENQFEALVSSTKNKSQITVGRGNETIYSGEPPHEFDITFEEEGYHELWASTDSEDEFEENNEYFKTVRVREKPEVAAIGPSEGLEDQLDEFYSVQNFDSVPENIDEFDNVLLKEPVQSRDLENYLIEGGGLIYTGDDYSPSYLPVEASEQDADTDAPVVILLMDISQNMGCPAGEGFECGSGDELENPSQEQIGMSLRLAAGIVDDEGRGSLPDNTRVSLMPYADRIYSNGIEEPRLLGTHRQEIVRDISSIRPQSEPAHHDRALIAANSLLSDIEADGNVVMISNGKIPFSANPSRQQRMRNDALDEARIMDGKLVTVGVDSGYQQPPDRGEAFLEELSSRTNGGQYFNANEDSLNFNFTAGGGSTDVQALRTTESNHFITRDYSVQASVPQIDTTEAKDTASELVSTSDGRPFLTTWRYGVGKVASFSGDNQELNALMTESPGLVGRTFSWTSRAEQRELWVEGSRSGDEFKLVSRSNKDNFTRRSENRYVNDLNPGDNGFYSEVNLTYSKNYRPEIERVGYNEDALAEITVDGRVYDEDEIDDFLSGLESESRENVESRDLRPYTLALTLLMYLGFVGLRKRNGLA